MSTVLTPLQLIEVKLDEILQIHKALPTWIQLTSSYAQECGYNKVDDLRRWCFNHLPPDLFEKRGKFWFIHQSALHLVKRKIK